MKIGWIGVGLMGSRMAKRLMDAGYDMAVCDPVQRNKEPLLALGAADAASPAELTGLCDVIFCMIPNAAVLKEIICGAGGVLETMPEGFPVIDMSTIDPESSAEAGAAIAEAGGDFIRCTVTGSTDLAESGELGIMVSGKKERYEQFLPLFRILGNRQHYLGAAEESRYMKICINMMLGVTMQMMAESLVLGEKAGLDWNAMIECICDSTAGAPMIKAKKDMYLKRDFTPMCTAKTLEKDMNLALNLGAKHGVSLPVTALTRQNYAAMRSLGIEELDYSAILEVNERMNGI